jgi:hypothetical protein
MQGMVMSYYFTVEDFASIIKIESMNITLSDTTLQPLVEKFITLKEQLQVELHKLNMALHIQQPVPAVRSASASQAGGSLALQYARHSALAATVERLMGREEIADNNHIDPFRHPVIEIRLMPDALAIELILAPDAWWDQENMVGKLTIEDHRTQFYKMLSRMDGDWRLGFWRGLHLSEMHLKTAQFQYRPIIEEFLGTFSPSKDWFRIGCWYKQDAPELKSDVIIHTLSQHMSQLYMLYHHFLWTSDNNYRNFYSESVS